MAQQFSDTKLAAAALALANKPRHLNPSLTPGAINQYPPSAQPLITAVLNHPVHSATARSGGLGGIIMAASGGTVRPMPDARQPTERHQLLGFNSTSIGTGATSSVTATPYAPFRGRRLVLSPLTIATGSPGYVNTLQVGVRPQFAALNNEPLEMFAAGMQSGYCELDEATPAIGISMNVAVTATVTVYGCVVGITRRNKADNRPQGANRKLLRMPLNISAGLAAAGSANYTVTPTLKFWARKIALGEADQNAETIMGLTAVAATGCAGQNTTGLFVGPNSQLANLPTATAPVPSSVFTPLYDLWLDLDMADTAVPITFQQTTISTVSCFFAGVIEGDAQYSDLATG